MPNFFEESKNETSGEHLSASQQELVDLMVPLVQSYYNASNLSKEEVEQALKTNITRLNDLVATVLATITMQQTQKQFDALGQADQSPNSFY